MTKWYDQNYASPYPTYRDIEHMANTGCISIAQVKQWFVNVRRRTQNKYRNTRERRTVSAQKEPATKQSRPIEPIQVHQPFQESSYFYYDQAPTPYAQAEGIQSPATSIQSPISIVNSSPVSYQQYQYPLTTTSSCYYNSNSSYAPSPLISNHNASYSSSLNSSLTSASTSFASAYNLDASSCYYSITTATHYTSDFGSVSAESPSFSGHFPSLSPYASRIQQYF